MKGLIDIMNDYENAKIHFFETIRNECPTEEREKALDNYTNLSTEYNQLKYGKTNEK
jgi:hypothetical protein